MAQFKFVVFAGLENKQQTGVETILMETNDNDELLWNCLQVKCRIIGLSRIAF